MSSASRNVGHTQKLEGGKFPENVRTKAVLFRELYEDALAYSKAENSAKQTYELRLCIDQLIEVFGARRAEPLRKNEIVVWLAEQAERRKWAPASRNRWQATFSMVFRVGIDNEKIDGYTWHCNRRTFASRLVMALVNLRTVAELLGNRTLQMVMRYSDLAGEHQAAAVDKLVDVGDKKYIKSDTESSRVDSRKWA